MKEGYTIPVTKEMVSAKGTYRVSTLSSQIIFKKINKMKFKDAKILVIDLVNKKNSLNGKFYSATSEEILKLLKSVETNALSRNFNPEEMILQVSAHKGPKLMRSRRKRNFGYKLKVTHLHAILKPSIKKAEVKDSKDEKKLSDVQSVPKSNLKNESKENQE